ncbi:hypothetical protein [Gilvibacter sp.]|uniref:hypothetical protein n=1 Tax=Gilvibacter sp. TaxID=2729997 RepID=UPI003F49FB68
MKMLLFLLLPVLAFGQLKLDDKTRLDADKFIGVDAYNNTYSVVNNALIKTSERDRWNYADFTLGSIAAVDIINPLRILVYYADFNIAVFLDNTLNEIERVNFNEVEDYLNIEAVRVANNNSVWVFNKDAQQLELYNYRSGKRSIISQPVEGNLVATASDFNFCHLLTDSEVITYNVYGSILRIFDNPGFTQIWTSPQRGLIALDEQDVIYFTEAPEQQFEATESGTKIAVKDLQLTSEFLYIYDGEFVYSFRLTKL